MRAWRQRKVFFYYKIRDAAYITLKEIQAGHDKGRSTHHENLLKPQQYLLTNKITNTQNAFLFNLRCDSEIGIRQNFSTMYFGDLFCRICTLSIYSQRHVMLCPVLNENFTKNQGIKYEFIHETLEQQTEVIKLYPSLMEVREQLLADKAGGIRAPTGTSIPDF